MAPKIISEWCGAELISHSKIDNRFQNGGTDSCSAVSVFWVGGLFFWRRKIDNCVRLHLDKFANHARSARLTLCHLQRRSTICRSTNRRSLAASSNSSRQNPIRNSRRWRGLRARSLCKTSAAPCASSRRFIFPTNALTIACLLYTSPSPRDS